MIICYKSCQLLQSKRNLSKLCARLLSRQLSFSAQCYKAKSLKLQKLINLTTPAVKKNSNQMLFSRLLESTTHQPKDQSTSDEHQFLRTLFENGSNSSSCRTAQKVEQVAVEKSSKNPKTRPTSSSRQSIDNEQLIPKFKTSASASPVPEEDNTYKDFKASLSVAHEYFTANPDRYPFYHLGPPEFLPSGTDTDQHYKSQFQKYCIPVLTSENDSTIDKNLGPSVLDFCQMEQLLKNFCNFSSIFVPSVSLITELDTRSCQLMPSLTTDQKFRLAAIWFQLSFKFNRIKIRTTKYFHSFVQHFCDEKHMEKLGHPGVVFLIFLCGCLRYYPGRHDRDKFFVINNGFALPKTLQLKLDPILCFDPFEEVGIIAHALYKVHFSVRSQQNEKQIGSIMLRRILELPDQDIQNHSIHISSVAKLVRDRGYRKTIHYANQVLSKLGPHIHLFEFEFKTRFLGLLISSRPNNYMSVLLNLIDSLDTLDGLRMKDLESLAYGFFFLNLPNDHKIYQLVLDEVDKQELDALNASRSFVYLISFLVKCGVYRKSQVEKIINAANSHSESLLKCETSSDFVDVSLNLFANLSDQEVSFSSLVREKERSSFLCSNALLALAETDLALEISHPEYDGPRLDAESRKRCLAVPRYAHLQMGTETDKMRQDIYQQLKFIFGEHVYFGHLMPHSTYPDCALLLDTTDLVKFSALPHNLIEADLTSQVARQSAAQDTHKWLVILLPKLANFCMDTSEPLGPILYKKKLLETLGYNVIVVHYTEYRDAQRNNRTRNFLLQKIHSLA